MIEVRSMQFHPADHAGVSSNMSAYTIEGLDQLYTDKKQLVALADPPVEYTLADLCAYIEFYLVSHTPYAKRASKTTSAKYAIKQLTAAWNDPDTLFIVKETVANGTIIVPIVWMITCDSAELPALMSSPHEQVRKLAENLQKSWERRGLKLVD